MIILPFLDEREEVFNILNWLVELLDDLYKYI